MNNELLWIGGGGWGGDDGDSVSLFQYRNFQFHKMKMNVFYTVYAVISPRITVGVDFLAEFITIIINLLITF